MMDCSQLDPDVMPILTASEIQRNIKFSSPHGRAYTVLSAPSLVDYRFHFGVNLNMPVREADMAKFASAVKSVWNSTRG